MAENTPHSDRSPRQVMAGGATLAAAAFMLVSAVVTVIEGISALANDQMVVVGPDYVYRFSGTTWGWVHIILGVLAGAVALGLFWPATWAKVAAIIIASLSIVTMFLWLPHSPVWSIVVIALDILVIWAVSTWDTPPAGSTSSAMRSPFSGFPAQPAPGSPWHSQLFGAFPSWATTVPSTFGGQPIRLEDRMSDSRCEIRAELPGIDPANDVEITARDGVLTIKAERSDIQESGRRSEFSYGSFVPSVSLPPGAKEDDITATYDKGILTVSVGLSDAGPTEKRVQVQSTT